ncbi:MAG TPA: hypothetical protein VF087_11125, partial [Solirubrobacteraceae bacterium]
AAGRVYNLVGDESVTVRGIADAVGDLLGGVEIVHTQARAADFAGAEVSGARAAAELGWRPATSFSEGLRRYVEWYGRDVAAPAPPAAPQRPSRLRRRPRLAPRLASLVLSWLTVFAVAGGLAAYLASISAVGLTAASDRTIAVLSVSTLAGYLAMALDGPRRAWWTFSGWALAAAGLVVIYTGEFRELLNLAGPDESRVLLGLAGGALAIAIADAGLRLRRTGEERLAADRA